MTKEVQLRGHEAEIANQFIGLDREVTVDTDNRELRLHDGVTPGGTRFLNRDQNDDRYQARSTELDGLLGWEPNEVGFVVRVGSGEYRLRVLDYDEDNILITNNEGHDASPKISLAVEIQTDHTFTGEITFTQPIQADGGVIGNLTGDVTGNLTGNVTGDVEGNLTGDVTGNVTGNLTGGFDTRGADIIMDEAQIDPSWIAGFGDALSQSGLPVGSIVMWGKPIADIPTNWKLCDGTGGTPDLRDKFVISVGVDNQLGDAGGAKTHDHALTTDPTGAHVHTGGIGETTLTVEQMPAHQHGSGICEDHDKDKTMMRWQAAIPPTAKGLDSGGSGGAFEALSDIQGGGQPHTHDMTMEEGGAHTHEGGTSEESHMPPYFALYFIMKAS